jgi:hypothetical protein
MDFDIADNSTIWLAALSGLYQYTLQDGTWSYTLYDDITGLNFVGCSADRTIVYVVTGLTKISPQGQTIYNNLEAGGCARLRRTPDCEIDAAVA